MNDIIRAVTPLTRGIIWLRSAALKNTDETYRSIDYLLDGLLTSSLNEGVDRGVLMGKSFNRNFYVYRSGQELDSAELKSFLSLLEKELKEEDRILIIDEDNAEAKLRQAVPKALHSRFHSYS
jgi:hypothetical protein